MQWRKHSLAVNNESIVNALISSGGDIALVTEKVNMSLPPDTKPIQEHEVLEAFIEAVSIPDSTAQNNIRAIMLLQLLSILTETKNQLQVKLDDFSPAEILRTMSMVIEGISTLMPAPAAAQQQNGTNINFISQFNNEAQSARNVIEHRMETYRKLGEAYNENPVGE